jgi:hypothetical protein
MLSSLVDLALMWHPTPLRSLKIAEVQSRFSKEMRDERSIVEEPQGLCSSQGVVITSQILPFDQRPKTNLETEEYEKF